MRTALAVLLCAATVPAAASFPVEIDAKVNGLAIEVLASSGMPLVVTFVSKEKANVTCKTSIASGLDTPVTKTVTAKAGKNTTVSFTLKSAPNRVRVIANCTPAAKKSDAKS